MKRTLKMTAIAVAIAGATLGMAGPAQAAVCTTLGTVAAWATAGTCTDVDNDMQFTFTGYSGNFGANALTTGLDISEALFGGIQIYNIGFDWNAANYPSGYAGGGGILYSATSLDPILQAINSSSLDTVVYGGTTGAGTSATKALFDVGADNTAFLTMTSTNGSHDPVSGGEYLFDGRTSINVVDTIDVATSGAYQHMNNTFNVTHVPEPASIALLGLGLAGLGLMRRRKV